MKLGKKLYVTSRNAWRSWLAKNHNTESEIWLVYYKKHAEQPRIPYNDAVEEALCYGWIDSIVKRIDGDRFAQRFTPRRKGSPLSEMNKERARRMISAGKMAASGLATVKGKLDGDFIIPERILAALKKDKSAWKNFQSFPEHYQRIRVAYVKGAQSRPEEFQRRLKHFLKMTAQNKKFGMVQ